MKKAPGFHKNFEKLHVVSMTEALSKAIHQKLDESNPGMVIFIPCLKIVSFMKLIVTLLLVVVSALGSLAQVPDVFHLNLNHSGNEKYPTMVAAQNGGFFVVYQMIKSNPDSAFGCIAYLNSGMEPQWNRLFKLRSNTVLSGTMNEPDGGVSFMLNGNNSSSLYFPIWIRMNSNGEVQQKIHLVDSTSTSFNSPVYYQTRLSNGSRIFATSSSGNIIHMDGNGTLDFSRQFRFKGLDTRGFFISQIAAETGTRLWYAVGGLHGGGPACMLKFDDTTLIASHLYNFNSPGSTGGINNIALLPNGDIQVSSNEGVSWVTLTRLTSDGNLVWTNSYKVSGTNPTTLKVGTNGDIWLSGALNAGQAGGILVHFSPTGVYLGHKGQFKLGFSHEPIRSVLDLPNNQLLTLQKAYYNNTNVLIFNRINPAMDFVCYTYPSGGITDTTLTVVDSVTTQMKKVVRRFGTSTTMPFPLQIYQPELVKGPVTCATSTSEAEQKLEIEIYPNPVSHKLYISGLPSGMEVAVFSVNGRKLSIQNSEGEINVEGFASGLYWVEIPDVGYRKKFVKE